MIMRIIVFSDVHGHSGHLQRLLQAQPDADGYIFCGDGIKEVERTFKAFPGLRLYSTPGNCDTFGDETMKFAEFNGVKAAYCHGHGFSVKSGTDDLLIYAAAHDAKIVLFGHTHETVCKYRDGIYYMNPGAIANGQNVNFGIIDISDNGDIACSTTSVRYDR